jgi:hypothetical protein
LRNSIIFNRRNSSILRNSIVLNFDEVAADPLQIHNFRNAQNQPGRRNSIVIDNDGPLLDGNDNFNQPQPRGGLLTDSFIEFLLGYQAIHANQRPNYEQLKRVSYEEEKDRLDSEDCSICIMPFNEDPDEKLLYLPCNRKHIFHETCIVEWLKQQSDCPL